MFHFRPRQTLFDWSDRAVARDLDPVVDVLGFGRRSPAPGITTLWAGVDEVEIAGYRAGAVSAVGRRVHVSAGWAVAVSSSR